MLPFVPRSVKRQRGGEHGAPRVPPRAADAPDQPRASAAARADALADALLPLLPDLSCPPTHLMRLLTHPLIAPLCTATADLHAALHTLAPLGCVALDGYIATIPAGAHTTIYVEGIPRRRPIDAARLVHALAGGSLFAMYAPTRDGGRAPLPTEVRSAFVDVDAAAARVLLDKWGWDADWMYGEIRGASDAAIDAAVSHVRCMSRATWLARRDEYLAWQRASPLPTSAARRRPHSSYPSH